MNAQERTREISDKKTVLDPPVILWCQDQRQEFTRYRVPVDALLLNIDNRRFAAERKLFEEQLGHALDPENSPDDELSIISILLDTGLHVDGNRVVGNPSKAYEALRTDWQQRNQDTPFWIRPDGKVSNGNRRLAIVKRLRAEVGLPGTERVEAIIIDLEEVDEEALFEMEQREQLTEDFKIRYTDINLLLTIRDAAMLRDIDWNDSDSIDRVASELQHIAGGDDKAYAVVQLDAIKYMDMYLDDSGCPGDYQKLLRQVERFRDIGKIIARLESDYIDDVPDMIRLCFAAVRAGQTNYDIRALRRMFIEDPDRYKSLVKAINEAEDDWTPDGPVIGDPDFEAIQESDETSDERDELSEPAVQITAEYPKEVVSTLFSNALDGLRARDETIISLLTQVWNRLELVNEKHDALVAALEADEDPRELIHLIAQWAKETEDLLAGETP